MSSVSGREVFPSTHAMALMRVDLDRCRAPDRPILGSIIRTGFAFSKHYCVSGLFKTDDSCDLFYFLFLSFGICERRHTEYLLFFVRFLWTQWN